ncbi:MAG TPA: O-antigen polysaccharide polymerase Wzy, partial [Terriglobia bacterium]|nr:O-antigen polysaccharide polymerase Wzy [Terriglobia bacterium]
NARRILVVSVLVALPRLIISLRWGRFFFAQAAVPIIFIALARGWVRLSRKLILSFGVFAAFVIFVPALTRGDYFFGPNGLINFFSAGSTLRLFQDNVGLDLSGKCPPLLVSLTAKTIPYSLLNVCTMEYLGSKGWPATLDRILTENDPATEGTLEGTGSNYLLELYLTGGVTAIVLGSVVFGFSSRCFVRWIGRRSAFAGIWAECLSRALFAPRSNLGYVYEKIPALVVATLVALWIAWLAHARSTAHRCNTAAVRTDVLIETPEAS